MAKWVVQFEQFNDGGEKVCGPFCVDLHCEENPDGHNACLTCTTFLCNPVAAMSLPPGVSTQTFAFPGTQVGDSVFAALGILPAGVSILSAAVPGDNTLSVTFDNTTGVAQAIVAQVLNVVATRQCEEA